MTCEYSSAHAFIAHYEHEMHYNDTVFNVVCLITSYNACSHERVACFMSSVWRHGACFKSVPINWLVNFAAFGVIDGPKYRHFPTNFQWTAEFGKVFNAQFIIAALANESKWRWKDSMQNKKKLRQMDSK